MGKVLKVREVGDPILCTKCKEVDIKNINQELLEEIEDLKETLNFTEGFGIAAPQVGLDKRIVIIQVNKEKCTYNNCEDIPRKITDYEIENRTINIKKGSGNNGRNSFCNT